MEAETEQPIIETIKVTCRNRREFKNLFGDGREVVDITLDKKRSNELDGEWLYRRINEENVFTRQHPNQKMHPEMVARLLCGTKYLDFKHKGIIPDLAHYDYRPLGIAHSEERDKEKQVLEARELWRKIV